MANRQFLCVLFFFCWYFQSYSQKKLVAFESRAPIPYAHILPDNKIYTFSNDKGEFEIPASQKFDTITISHLSYETLLLSYTDFQKSDTFILHEKTTVLSELTITPSKKKKKTEILLPEKSLRDKLYSNDNHRLLIETVPDALPEGKMPEEIQIFTAVYIPNNKQIENAVIKKIILTSNPKKKPGDERYALFKVNLMSYDTLTKLPKERIFDEDLSVAKKRGETLTIDLSREDAVTFPKEGICVMVSVYDTLFYINMGNMTPPAFKPALIPKSSAYRQYHSFGKTKPQWEEPSYSKERIQCFDFGIEIEYYK